MLYEYLGKEAPFLFLAGLALLDGGMRKPLQSNLHNHVVVATGQRKFRSDIYNYVYLLFIFALVSAISDWQQLQGLWCERSCLL